MKVSQRIGLLLFLFSQLALCGFAQYGIITTYAGPQQLVTGAQATTQAIGSPNSVATDGVGGFYFTSYLQNSVYRVAANGTLSLE
jgi:hypothetical protein